MIAISALGCGGSGVPQPEIRYDLLDRAIEVKIPVPAESTPDASIWMALSWRPTKNESVYGQIGAAVIWTDDTGADEELPLALGQVKDPVQIQRRGKQDILPEAGRSK